MIYPAVFHERSREAFFFYFRMSTRAPLRISTLFSHGFSAFSEISSRGTHDITDRVPLEFFVGILPVISSKNASRFSPRLFNSLEASFHLKFHLRISGSFSRSVSWKISSSFASGMLQKHEFLVFILNFSPDFLLEFVLSVIYSRSFFY